MVGIRETIGDKKEVGGQIITPIVGLVGCNFINNLFIIWEIVSRNNERTEETG